ncbi:hypothetical protein F4553_004321 [Allocatelliglobosispora scoriae]|uniref:DUF4192 domain-containing protein n=1 Tax=Allocatelliglobosispora scoriae TaxID=643052 RepID=A0A841BW03_9ACTN|nr:DUF4192 domain-containing protein [Allocatelliglobosispora scoriae]MBB5870942.1 hypothetical protein [Allocatelliglobosispora scoriae]
MTEIPTLRLSDPADVAAAVPYLLGFHPTESIVVLGLQSMPPATRRIVFSARWDIIPETQRLAVEVAEMVRRQRSVESVLLIAFGSAETAVPALEACRVAIWVPVGTAVRVTDDRCYCVLCDECMPPEGLLVGADRSRVAAEATFLGLGVFPDRDALVRSVGPIGGLQPIAMAQAVARADERLIALIESSATESDPFGGQVLRRAGVQAVDEAMAAAQADRLPDDDTLAWLTLMLESIAVRDHAWESTDRAPWQLRFWLDVTRRAHPELVTPSATLLAFAAWRAGDGALAGVALARALSYDPHYSLALLLRDAMQQGIGPEALGRWPFGSAKRRRKKSRRRGVFLRR